MLSMFRWFSLLNSAVSKVNQEESNMFYTIDFVYRNSFEMLMQHFEEEDVWMWKSSRKDVHQMNSVII